MSRLNTRSSSGGGIRLFPINRLQGMTHLKRLLQIFFFMVLFVFSGMSLSAQFGGGAGTAGDPYKITSRQDLNDLSSQVAAGNTFSGTYFVLAKDVNMYDGGANASFTPIGSSSVKAFEGYFDGAGYKILNLYINTTASYVGLFGYATTGTLKNITITNADITTTGSYAGVLAGRLAQRTDSCVVSGKITGATKVGGFVGELNSTVTNCRADCSVTGVGTVGGFCGLNEGGRTKYCVATGDVTATNGSAGGFLGVIGNGTGSTGYLEYSYATGNVTATGSAGGFVGSVGVGGALFNYCYAAGDVTSTGNWVGGFCGSNSSWMEGTVAYSYCYALGDVSGSEEVGGFVGELVRPYNVGTLIIENSYAAGKVSGTASVGGFAGSASGNPTISNCYYNSVTSGQSTGVGAGSYTGTLVARTTQEMMIPSFCAKLNMAEGNQTNPFKVASIDINRGYPTLMYRPSSPQAPLVVSDTVMDYKDGMVITLNATAGSNDIWYAANDPNFPKGGTAYIVGDKFYPAGIDSYAIYAHAMPSKTLAGATKVFTVKVEPEAQQVVRIHPIGDVFYQPGKVISLHAMSTNPNAVFTFATDPNYGTIENLGAGLATLTLGNDYIDSFWVSVSVPESDGYAAGMDSAIANLVKLPEDAAPGDCGPMLGRGTAADPYQVVCRRHLDAISDSVSFNRSAPDGYTAYNVANYRLMRDIDMTIEGANPDFIPIGTRSFPFKGVFDGMGHSITSLYITKQSSYGDVCGLFGNAQDAKIKNVKLINPRIYSQNVNTGILVGSLKNGSVEDCVVENGFINAINGGGIVGLADSAMISRCASSLVFVASIDIVTGIGGIVGSVETEGSKKVATEIHDCRSIINVVAREEIFRVGGIVGRAGIAGIYNCHASLTINGNAQKGSYKHIGGIAGSATMDPKHTVNEIMDCTADVAISINDAFFCDCIGGIVGSGSEAFTKEVAMYNCHAQGYISIRNTVTSSLNNAGIGGAAGACGFAYDCTADVSIELGHSGEEFSQIGGFAGRMYRGGAENCAAYGDISLTYSDSNFGYSVGGFVGAADYSNIRDCTAYGKIVGDAEFSFIGGFVGDILHFSTISNCTAYGDIVMPNASVVGGFIGIGAADLGDVSIIEDCHAYGKVTGKTELGGFAGALGLYDSTLILRSCSAASTVKGSSNLGGFAGYITGFMGAMEGCYSQSEVYGDSSGIGGFAGFIYGESFVLRDCYSTGAVAGVDSVGSFAGQIAGTTLKNVYASGYASGTNSVGGFAGVITDLIWFAGVPEQTDMPTFENVYYDERATGHQNVAGNFATYAGVTPKTTAEMQIRSFAALLNGNEANADTAFKPSNLSVNKGYPVLYYQPSSPMATLVTGDSVVLPYEQGMTVPLAASTTGNDVWYTADEPNFPKGTSAVIFGNTLYPTNAGTYTVYAHALPSATTASITDTFTVIVDSMITDMLVKIHPIGDVFYKKGKAISLHAVTNSDAPIQFRTIPAGAATINGNVLTLPNDYIESFWVEAYVEATANHPAGSDSTLVNLIDINGDYSSCGPMKGKGTQDDPYLVACRKHLDAISDSVNNSYSPPFGYIAYDIAHYKVMRDIDMLIEGQNPAFTPIGTYSAINYQVITSFKGVFDGNNHAISNLYISGTGSSTGFFAAVTGDGVVKNVHLINPNVTGIIRVGALIGSTLSDHLLPNETSDSPMVINCSVTGGSVTATKHVLNAGMASTPTIPYASAHASFYGGLIGSFYGAGIYDCTVTGTTMNGYGFGGGLTGWVAGTMIDNCHASGKLNGALTVGSTSLGGLVGVVELIEKDRSTKFRDIYIMNSTADVDVSGIECIGGFIGGISIAQSYTSFGKLYVSNCKAFGDVATNDPERKIASKTSSSEITGYGGFIGGLQRSQGIHYIEVADCAAYGSVNGYYYVGGFVGVPNSGTYSNCHAYGSVYANGGNVGGFTGCHHVGTNTYNHCSASGMVTLASNAPGNGAGGFIGNGNFATCNFCDAYGDVRGPLYSGGFAGNRITRAMDCRAYGDVYQCKGAGGFIGYFHGSRIERSEAINSVLSETQDGAVVAADEVGGFIGVFAQGTVLNSTAHGDVYGKNHVGGFFGRTKPGVYICLLQYCTALGNVTATGDNGGGFAGYLDMSTLTYCMMIDCDAKGDVDVGGSNAGGFAGYGCFQLYNSSAVGNVTCAGAKAGGFIGAGYGVNMGNFATGNVKADSMAGGYIGHLELPTSPTFNNQFNICYATGNVEVAGDHAGGFAGVVEGANLTAGTELLLWCYATGEVSGRDEIGGFAGSLNQNVASCYATGAVHGRCAAGFAYTVGSDAVIENSYTAAQVEGTSVGGFAGVVDGASMLDNNYYDITRAENANPQVTGDVTGASAKSTQAMQIVTFVSLLNRDINETDSIFKPSSLSVNNGYPVLHYQPSSQAATLAFSDTTIVLPYKKGMTVPLAASTTGSGVWYTADEPNFPKGTSAVIFGNTLYPTNAGTYTVYAHALPGTEVASITDNITVKVDSGIQNIVFFPPQEVVHKPGKMVTLSATSDNPFAQFVYTAHPGKIVGNTLILPDYFVDSIVVTAQALASANYAASAVDTKVINLNLGQEVITDTTFVFYPVTDVKYHQGKQITLISATNVQNADIAYTCTAGATINGNVMTLDNTYQRTITVTATASHNGIEFATDSQIVNVWGEHDYEWEGDGTLANPYRIAWRGHLETLADSVAAGNTFAGKHFVVVRDFSMKSGGTTVNFEPIGTFILDNNPANRGFSGTLDGAGHIISDLYIDAAVGSYGLFGYAVNAQVRDLGLENVIISGAAPYTGALAANFSGTIINCYSTGVVTSSQRLVGGLVGAFEGGMISNSYSTVAVNSTLKLAVAHVGGLVGQLLNNGIVTESYATGAVTATYDNIGGLVGSVQPTASVIRSYATGNVSGHHGIAGGLVGQCYGDIAYSYATGAVTVSDMEVGGLVGWLDKDARLSYSYATGNVQGFGNVGGLCGSIGNSSNATVVVSNCYAIGNVTTGAFGFGGGLSGYIGHGATATNCYAAGTVTGPKRVGGLIGAAQAPVFISYSYFDRQTSGQTDAIGAAMGTPTVTEVAGIKTWEMQTPWLVSVLGDAWKQSDDALNGGYPVLEWQRSSLLPTMVVANPSIRMTYARNLIVPLQATTNSGAGIVFMSEHDSAVVSAGQLLIYQAGTYEVVAFSPPTADYAGDSRLVTVIVDKAEQLVDFKLSQLRFTAGDTLDLASDRSGTAAAVALPNASNGSYARPILYTSSDPAVEVNGNRLLAHAFAQNVVITATQAGDVNYLPADAQIIVSVARRATEVVISPMDIAAFKDMYTLDTVALTTAAIGPITWVVSANASVNGNILTVNNAGPVSVTATLAQTDSYEATQSETYTFITVGARKANMPGGATIYVQPWGCGKADGSSPSDATGILNFALDKAAAGTTINAAAGTFSAAKINDAYVVNADLRLNDGVSLVGGFDAVSPWYDVNVQRAGYTTIDGENQRRLLSVTADRFTVPALISGIEFRDGVANTGASYSAAALRVVENMTVSDCYFFRNSASDMGGAVTVENGSIINSTFAGNRALRGGAVYTRGNDPRIVNCFFYGNTVSATGDGTAICNEALAPYLVNNTIVGADEVPDNGVKRAMSKSFSSTKAIASETQIGVYNTLVWGAAAADFSETVTPYNCAFRTVSEAAVNPTRLGYYVDGENDWTNDLFPPNFVHPNYLDSDAAGYAPNAKSVLINRADSNIYAAAIAGIFSPTKDSDILGNARLAKGWLDIGAVESADAGLLHIDADPQTVFFNNTVQAYTGFTVRPLWNIDSSIVGITYDPSLPQDIGAYTVTLTAPDTASLEYGNWNQVSTASTLVIGPADPSAGNIVFTGALDVQFDNDTHTLVVDWSNYYADAQYANYELRYTCAGGTYFDGAVYAPYVETYQQGQRTAVTGTTAPRENGIYTVQFVNLDPHYLQPIDTDSAVLTIRPRIVEVDSFLVTPTVVKYDGMPKSVTVGFVDSIIPWTPVDTDYTVFYAPSNDPLNFSTVAPSSKGEYIVRIEMNGNDSDRLLLGHFQGTCTTSLSISSEDPYAGNIPVYIGAVPDSVVLSAGQVYHLSVPVIALERVPAAGQTTYLEAAWTFSSDALDADGERQRFKVEFDGSSMVSYVNVTLTMPAGATGSRWIHFSLNQFGPVSAANGLMLRAVEPASRKTMVTLDDFASQDNLVVDKTRTGFLKPSNIVRGPQPVTVGFWAAESAVIDFKVNYAPGILKDFTCLTAKSMVALAKVTPKSSTYAVTLEDSGYYEFLLTFNEHPADFKGYKVVTIAMGKSMGLASGANLKKGNYRTHKIQIINDKPFVSAVNAAFAVDSDLGFERELARYIVITGDHDKGEFAHIPADRIDMFDAIRLSDGRTEEEANIRSISLTFPDTTATRIELPSGGFAEIFSRRVIGYYLPSADKKSDIDLLRGYRDSFFVDINEAGAGTQQKLVNIHIGSKHTRGTTLLLTDTMINLPTGGKKPVFFGTYDKYYVPVKFGSMPKPSRVALKNLTPKSVGSYTLTALAKLELRNTKLLNKAMKTNFVLDILDSDCNTQTYQRSRMGVEVQFKQRIPGVKGTVDKPVAAMVIVPPTVDTAEFGYISTLAGSALSGTYTKLQGGVSPAFLIRGSYFGDKPTVYLQYINAKGKLVRVKGTPVYASKKTDVMTLAHGGTITMPSKSEPGRNGFLTVRFPAKVYADMVLLDNGRARFDIVIDSRNGIGGKRDVLTHGGFKPLD